jgi:hypothetical protein
LGEHVDMVKPGFSARVTGVRSTMSRSRSNPASSGTPLTSTLRSMKWVWSAIRCRSLAEMSKPAQPLRSAYMRRVIMVQAASPVTTRSNGLGPAFWPPLAGGSSATSAWPATLISTW